MISGLSFLFMSILLMLSQRGIVTFFDERKDVIPLRAFFERRPLNHYDNVTVILVQLKKGMLSDNKITGCGIDGVFASSFEVLLLDTYKNYAHRFSPSLTHDEAIILCYDLRLPQHKIKPFVTYINTYNYPIQVETKSDLILNAEVKRKDSNETRVLLCATQIMGTEWLSQEWIQYQRKLGIDFIHLYTKQTMEFVESRYGGFIYVDKWQSQLADESHIILSQSLQYMDCLYRYQGLFDYVLVYDTSDYFVPMMANTFDLKDYIKMTFNHLHTGSVLLRRVVYSINDGCHFKAQLHNHTVNKSSNISHTLQHQEFKELGLVTKGIHKISVTREITPQKAVSLMPGYTTEKVSPKIAYIVHIRNRHDLQCS